MAESSWESTRSAQKKKIIFSILIVFPVLLIAGILFINNRELITRENQDKPVRKIVEKTTESLTYTNEKKDISTADVKKEKEETLTAVSEKSKSAVLPTLKESTVKTPESQNKMVPLAAKKEVVPDKKREASSTVSLLSEQLAPIECTLLSRKDIVISLSLELFFSDEDTRSTIRLYRDDIKIMVLKSVRNRKLSEMTTRFLETLLLNNINSIFDNNLVIKLKISNIKVEKADK